MCVCSISAAFTLGEAKGFWWDIKDLLMWCVEEAVSIKGSVVARKRVPTSSHREKFHCKRRIELCTLFAHSFPPCRQSVFIFPPPWLGLQSPFWMIQTILPFSHQPPCSKHRDRWLYNKYISHHLPRNKRLFLSYPFSLNNPTTWILSLLPFPPCASSHLWLFILLWEVCACVCVVQCAGREQLEHLQSSPLTAARHMAGPCEGWVLSPGKVLTHRQERRAALTPWGRGGNSWTSAPHSFILPPPPHSRRDGVEEP